MVEAGHGNIQYADMQYTTYCIVGTYMGSGALKSSQMHIEMWQIIETVCGAQPFLLGK